MNRPIRSISFLTAALLSSYAGWAAQNNQRLFDKPTTASVPLFPDPIVAKGKGFAIKQSEVEEKYLQFKGQRAAVGEPVADDPSRIQAEILERLIATQLFVTRASEQDKKTANDIATSFLSDQKKQAPSEESFRRQVVAMGMTPEQYEAQIHEQAVVKAVIDREIKATKNVADAEVKTFYSNNPSLFQEPELVRASHILISTRDSITSKPLTPELKLEKKRLAAKIRDRAKAGEDFGKLVKEFSDDQRSKERAGEYTFARAKDDPRRAMIPEFEAAAFSMSNGQISDVVETGYGYHIIKTIERIPGKKIPFDQVQTRIKDSLLREAVDKALPDYIEKLRKEAGVEILASGDKK